MRPLVILVFCLFHLGYSLAQEAEPFCSKQLALGWAPVHYQAIRNSDGIFNSNSLNGKSDSLSTINFDGDWNADNNWDNLTTQPLEPAVLLLHCSYFNTLFYNLRIFPCKGLDEM